MSTVDSPAATRSVKDQVRTLLDSLPNDCTFEDVQYGLFVLDKIRLGKEQLDRGEGIPHEEVVRQVKQWFKK